MPAEFNPLALVNSILWVIVAYGLSYCLLAFGLSLFGARVRQRSTWLAWLPIFNFYLMCRLARAPLLFVLPLCVPLLNLLVFAYLGARMAKRLDRSPVLGALFGLPLLGNLIPLVLALGHPTEEEKAAPPLQPPLVTAMIHAGVVFTLILLPIGGALLANRFTRNHAPVSTVQQVVASLPPRVAGTLTEFPIDPATTHAAIPSGPRTETFQAPQPGEKPRAGLNSEQLPPWIDPESIPALAESATSANYTATDTGAQVKVVNLALRADQTGDPAAPSPQELAALSPEAKVTGVEVKSTNDTTYRGYRVNTPDSVYYALRRADSNSLVLISAKDRAGVEVAGRLAANLGNGQGLLEDETGRSSVAHLPPAPPNTKLLRMESTTVAELDAMMARLNNPQLLQQFAEQHQAPEEQRLAAFLFPIIRAMMPRSYTLAAYAPNARPQDEGCFAAAAGFSAGSDAWTALQALKTLVRFFKQVQGDEFRIELRSVEVGGCSGLVLDSSSKNGESFSAFVLRQDNYLLGFASGKGSSDDLRPWVESSLARK